MLMNIMSVGRSALRAQQASVQVASHNLANAQTEGYSRQRADLVDAGSVPGPGGLYGRGVDVSQVTRQRDALMDATYRRESSSESRHAVQGELLAQMEAVFGELSESGFSQTMETFWASWSDLANNPTSTSARSLLSRNAERVTVAMHQYAASLASVRETANDRLGNAVTEINSLSSEIASLNRQILTANSINQNAPALEDERDRSLDRLSTLAGVEARINDDGTASVYLGTSSLVDGVDSRSISLDAASGRLSVGSTPVRGLGGEMAGLLEVRDVDVPDVLAKLDEFAAQLVEEVNVIHRAGTGLNFFEPTRGTAASIALSADVSDPSTIGLVPNAIGDNRVALDVAALRDRGLSFPSGSGKTFGEFYTDTVSDLGLRVRTAQQAEQVYGTLADQAEARRASVSGVSSDEELSRLMQHQQAYSAAAKLISTADEMLRTILALA